MAKVRAANELNALLDTFVHTNVTGLTADPNIRRIYEDPPTADPTNGEIIIGEERMRDNYTTFDYRREEFDIEIMVYYHKNAPSSDQTLMEICYEIQRILDAENLTADRAFRYSVRWDYSGAIEYGQVLCTVNMVRALLQITGVKDW